MAPPESEDHPTRVQELFEACIELSPAEQIAFLDQSCRDDTAVRREVELLLKMASAAELRLQRIKREILDPALSSLREHPQQMLSWFDSTREDENDGADPFIGQTVSHFKILAPLGRGGMGIVYEAQDQRLDRKVALKFLPPTLQANKDARERFIHEAKTASSLEHPKIATIYEIDETADHRWFIAMRYYRGQTLKEQIKEGPLTPEGALRTALELTAALSVAHRQGIVHRDIKPGNVIIGEEDEVTLLDFGLAEPPQAITKFPRRTLGGTVAYMSPEQVRGESVDGRSDLWSLGVMLFEMLVGERPFAGGNLTETIEAILTTDPFSGNGAEAPQASIPKPVCRVLERCLTKDPAARSASAGELEADLQRALDEIAPAARAASSRWWPHSRRNQALAGVLVITVVTVVAIGLNRRPTASAEAGITFTRVSEEAFGDITGGFGGAYWGDYDADGWADFFTSGVTPMLFHNEGDGTFKRVLDAEIEKALPSDIADPLWALWADFENDGDLDLYIPYFHTQGGDRHRFFLNNGDGTFRRVLEDWIPSTASISASWGDIDNDGLLDLFAGRFRERGPTVYHHQEDGSLVPVAVELGESYGSVWSDLDLDGDVDLVVIANPSSLFRNEGDLSFTPVSPEILPGAPLYLHTASYGVATGDYDNDGDLDLVISNQSYNRIYRNDREAGWVELKGDAISQGSSIGPCLWGDYDNDGFLDLFFAGDRYLYHNEGDGTFSQVENTPLVDEELYAGGGAWADYDNDGDLDVLLGDGMRWGMLPTNPPRPLALYRNDGGTNHWLNLNLVGTRSNRSAIGAKVFLRATIRGAPLRQLREVTSGGGYGTQNDLRVHFGLGDAEVVESIRIEWPSGQVDEWGNVDADQFLEVQEGATSLQPIRHKRS